MKDYAKILQEAYNTFLLPLGGKIVPTPYRINIPYQKDRKKYGKSSPQTLIRHTKQFAKEQNFDLGKATAVEIRKFMIKNKLGIDCSGFVYHLLNYLLKKTGKGSLMDNGFPKASSTNVEILTNRKFTIPVDGFENVKPGDLIRLTNQYGGFHVFLVLDRNGVITYAHSSENGNSKGVCLEKISNDNLPKNLDGIWRLKVLG